MSQVQLPRDLPAELVVVDNGSTDRTEELVGSHESRALPLRYINEPCAGLAYARNAGLRRTRGEIILFTDDDVRPGPAWIEEMCRPIHAGQADSVAGRVALAPHLERPWLQQRHRSLFASRSLDALAKNTVGANMASARRVLDKVPLFDPELGAGALGFGEDTLFSLQLLRAGYRHIVGSTDTTVEHHFEEDRLLHSSLVNSAEQRGRSRAYVAYHWNHLRTTHRRSRLLKAYGKLLLSLAPAAASRSTNGHREGIGLRELGARLRIAFLQQLRIEEARSPNYEPYGLCKLGGRLDALE